jgi:hypothetical protein
MFLHKFCPIEFNPLEGCQTIRLGTLEGYRNEENQEIADELEGLQVYHVGFYGEGESAHLIEDLLPQVNIAGRLPDLSWRPPGLFSHEIRNINRFWTSDGRPGTSADATIEYYFPNCLLFCMSQGLWNHDTPFSGYDSRWSIRKKDVGSFGRRIETELRRMAKTGQIKLSAIGNNSKRFEGPFQISSIFQEVRYDKQARVEIHLENDPLKELSDLLWRSPFSKPSSFSNETEFRFLYFFTSDDIPLEVANEPILVRTENLVSKFVNMRYS